MKNTKIKKIMLISGVCLICGGVVAIALNNGTSAKVEASGTSSTSTEVSSDAPVVSPAPILTIGNVSSAPQTGTGSAFDPSKENSRSEPLTVVSKPTSQPPKPVIEGDSKDGKQPTNPALTNKTKKPTYKSKPKAQPAAPKKQSTSSKAKNDTPKDGDKKDGKTYVDGWGWVEGTGGGTGTTVDGDWGEGPQVGIMD